MHRFLEWVVLLAVAWCALHAVRTRGRRGGWMIVALLVLGFVRETLVVARAVLYEFAPLSMVLGEAPVIASTIWAFSIYAAIVWAETVTGERFAASHRTDPARRRPARREGDGTAGKPARESLADELRRRLPSWRFLVAVAGFMIALVGFYEPFLSRVDMARWQPGTLIWNGVPLIALIGYPTLALLFVVVWSMTRGWRRHVIRRRPSVLAVSMPLIAWLHVLGLDRLKTWLGW